MPVDLGKLSQSKRVVAWRAWFVSVDDPNNLRLLRFDSEEHGQTDLPSDGFLMAKTRLADGCHENIGGNGWVVYQTTHLGLIFQATGDNNRPDETRYVGAKFIRDKLCPSALLTVASEEMKQWR